MDDKASAFFEANRSAAMITLSPKGMPHAVRVGLGLVDGRLLSSGTSDRTRTRNLRRDPRCTLFVFSTQGPGYMGLETTVTIIDGPEVPDLSLRLFQGMQPSLTPAPQPGNVVWFGVERAPDEFRRMMVEEGRVLYEFEVTRAYGIY